MLMAYRQFDQRSTPDVFQILLTNILSKYPMNNIIFFSIFFVFPICNSSNTSICFLLHFCSSYSVYSINVCLCMRFVPVCKLMDICVYSWLFSSSSSLLISYTGDLCMHARSSSQWIQFSLSLLSKVCQFALDLRSFYFYSDCISFIIYTYTLDVLCMYCKRVISSFFSMAR